MPARYSLHNGLYGHQNGLTTNEGDWNFSVPTLPRALQRSGYHTAMIGKCHGHEAIPTKFDLRSQKASEDIHALGYDHVDQVSGKSFAWFIECPYTQYLREQGCLDAYLTEGKRLMDGGASAPSVIPTEHNMDVYITDRIVNWLGQYDQDKPFFMWAGLCAPHGPFDPPAELAVNYKDAPIPKPIDHPDPASVRNDQELYAAQVELIDQQVGRILDALEASGMSDNTLVVFVSDHGEVLGDHQKDGKCEPWEASIRVPCIMRWPGVISAGQQTDAMIELPDLTATMMEVGTGNSDINQELPGTPGRSLAQHWQAPETAFREQVYAEDGGQFTPAHPAFQMIKTPAWKYAYYPEDDSELLIDMANDPGELDNLAGDPVYAEAQHAMRNRLLKHMATMKPAVA
jgi:arylsulfatase A-like enzyme